MVPKMVAVESGGQVCSQSVIHIQQLPWLAVDRLWPLVGTGVMSKFAIKGLVVPFSNPNPNPNPTP